MRETLAPLLGSVTGLGPHPGTDPRQACATVVGELTVAYLPELPDRGIGADPIGRTAGLLVDMGLDASTTGYRIGAPGGRVARRVDDYLQWDLDAFEEAYESAGRRGGGLVKTQAVGPLSLAAGLELLNGHRVPRDKGALRDLTDSLAEGLARHVQELRRRTGADVVLQLDEPSLAAVVRGSVPALTRLDPIPPLPKPEAADLLSRVCEAAGAPVLLRLRGPIEWDVVRRTPIDGAFVDIAALTEHDYEGFGTLAESAAVIGLGLVPATDGGAPVDPQRLASPAVRIYREIGLRKGDLAQATVTPARGLSSVPADQVRPMFDTAKRVAIELAEAAQAD